MISGLSLRSATPGSVDAAGVFHPPTDGLGLYGTMTLLAPGFVGYSYSEMMHNAMLRGAGRADALSQISGAGIGLGQLSSALCLIGLVIIVLVTPALGDASTGYLLQRGAGPFVALWLLAFVVPFFLYVPGWRASGRVVDASGAADLLEGRQAQPAGGGHRCVWLCPGHVQGVSRADEVHGGLPDLQGWHHRPAGAGRCVVVWRARLGVVENALYGIWASIFAAIGW